MRETYEGGTDPYDPYEGMFDNPEGKEYEDLQKKFHLSIDDVETLATEQEKKELKESGRFKDEDIEEFFKNRLPDRTTIVHVAIKNFLAEKENSSRFYFELKALRELNKEKTS